MTLDKHDLQWCLRRAPHNVLKLLKKVGPELVVSGGYIRACVANEKISDIDLFVRNKEKAEEFAKELAGNSKIYTTDNAYTVRGKRGYSVQFIHRWTFDEPSAILNSFDFTIACAAFWFDGTWQSLCDDRFYSDLAAKRLIYRSPVRNEDAGGSLLRVLKFYQRGYRIPLDSFGACIARLVMAIDFDKLPQTDEPKEKKIARVLTGLLREVDPNVDPDHIAHLPSTEE